MTKFLWKKFSDNIWGMNFKEIINFVELWANIMPKIKRFKNPYKRLVIPQDQLTRFSVWSSFEANKVFEDSEDHIFAKVSRRLSFHIIIWHMLWFFLFCCCFLFFILLGKTEESLATMGSPSSKLWYYVKLWYDVKLLCSQI